MGNNRENLRVGLNTVSYIKNNYTQRHNIALGYKMQAQQRPAITFGYESPLREVAKHCAYCGVEMLRESEADILIQKILNSKGFTLQNHLLSLINKLKQRKDSSLILSRKMIFESLYNISLQQENKKGLYIINNFLAQKEIEFKDEIVGQTAQKQKVFNELLKMKNILPEYAQEQIDQLIELNPARLITVLNEIEVIKRKCDKAYIDLPEQFIQYNDNIVKQLAELKNGDLLKIASQDGARELLTKIITPLIVTMEHVQPHSKDGDDNTFNYLPVCGECNLERGNIDFTEALNKKPEIAFFIENALREVKQAINRLVNPPQELTDYIEKICQTLKIESKGKLDIVV